LSVLILHVLQLTHKTLKNFDDWILQSSDFCSLHNRSDVILSREVLWVQLLAEVTEFLTQMNGNLTEWVGVVTALYTCISEMPV
jgi:hypothetical protein